MDNESSTKWEERVRKEVVKNTGRGAREGQT